MDYFLYGTSKNGIINIYSFVLVVFALVACIFIYTTFLIRCKHLDTEIFENKWKDNKFYSCCSKRYTAVFGTMDLWPKVVKLNFKCTIITMVIAEIISLSLIQMNCFYYMSIYSHYTPIMSF